MNRDSGAIVLTFLRSNCSVSINGFQALGFLSVCLEMAEAKPQDSLPAQLIPHEL